MLVGGTPVTNLGAAVQTPGFSGGGNTDPAVGFINCLEDVQIIENNRRNIASYEQFKTVYTELIKGESSGLTQLQLDQVDNNLQQARQSLVSARTTYRSDNDNFKLQMGLPPDTPLILDRRLTKRFREVYNGVDAWQRDPKRDLKTWSCTPRVCRNSMTWLSTGGRSSGYIISIRRASTPRTRWRTCCWPPSGRRWSTASTS